MQPFKMGHNSYRTHHNMKYTILDSSEVSSIDFNEVKETSADSLRYSIDNSKVLLKWDGSTPSFLSSPTEYTHAEISTILNGSEWIETE